jgi:hypothetical protein
MGRTVKKKPYYIERDDSGKWVPWNDEEYDDSTQAQAALKTARVPGEFRIIAVCARLRVEVETVTKVAMTEV